jgi:hypothetical protein
LENTPSLLPERGELCNAASVIRRGGGASTGVKEKGRKCERIMVPVGTLKMQGIWS